MIYPKLHINYRGKKNLFSLFTILIGYTYVLYAKHITQNDNMHVCGIFCNIFTIGFPVFGA